MTMMSMPKSEPFAITCWDRLRWEVRPCYQFFSIEEPSGQHVNVESCFAPRRRPCHGGTTALLRVVLLTWTLQVSLLDLYTYPPHNLYIYMGYLTHWGHFLTILYFLMALACTLRSSVVLKQPLSEEEPLHVWTRWMWGLYDTVAPLEVVITLLYWASGIVSDVTYISVMEHGGLALLVLLDGLVISLIPVRVKHVVFLEAICLTYLGWTLVDAVLDIGNGEWGPAYHDDALYPVLNWKQETKAAAILSAFAICILAPLAFMTCWLLSLLSTQTCACDASRRPLYDQDELHTSTDSTAFDYHERSVDAPAIM